MLHILSRFCQTPVKTNSLNTFCLILSIKSNKVCKQELISTIKRSYLTLEVNLLIKTLKVLWQKYISFSLSFHLWIYDLSQCGSEFWSYNYRCMLIRSLSLILLIILHMNMTMREKLTNNFSWWPQIYESNQPFEDNTFIEVIVIFLCIM